jgi:endonuclease/exonuclease/phosphatase family metal-dependent hydrolase
MTVNIHMGVPEGLPLSPANESLEALRDVAAFIKKANPDVVLVQEVRDRPAPAEEGLENAATLLGQLMGATGIAFTPALDDGKRRYGTAVYTRNGYTVEKFVNAALPNTGEEVEPRSAGIVAVRGPDGDAALTVISTHLAHRPQEDAALRDAQLGTLGNIAESIRVTGSFTYTPAQKNTEETAEDFPRHVVLGGDLNQTQAPSDAVLRKAGLVHVNDNAGAGDLPTALAGDGTPHRIDHLYATAGILVIDVAVAPVPAVNCTVGSPTDHKTVTAYLRRRR